MYCEKCKLCFEDTLCPVCGNRKVRQIDEKDLCFLVKKDQLWSGLVADVLKKNQIPFIAQNELGAGLTAKIGLCSERNLFYVPYEYLQRATDLLGEIFPGDSIQ